MPSAPLLSRERNDGPSPEGSPRQFLFTRAFKDSSQNSFVTVSKDVLGGKGEGLQLMTRLDLPVPPGFTISRKASNTIRLEQRITPKIGGEIREQLHRLEQDTGLRLGDEVAPLLVSVRSGGKYSMAGAMDTITNVGMTDKTLPALTKIVGTHEAQCRYTRLVQQFALLVYHIDQSKVDSIVNDIVDKFEKQDFFDLPEDAYIELRSSFQHLIRVETNQEFTQDAETQVFLATQAVSDSWNSPKATAYRERFGIPHDLGTAITIMKMVFGNTPGDSAGSGVIITRNPKTLEGPVVAFARHAQGAKVVGIKPHDTLSIDELPIDHNLQQQLKEYIQILTKAVDNQVLDIEFTIEHRAGEDPQLYFLQERQAKLTKIALVRWVMEQYDKGAFDEDTAIRHTTRRMLRSVFIPPLDPSEVERATSENRVLMTGLAITLGVASGPTFLSLDEARQQKALEGILVVDLLKEEDILHLPPNIIGIVAQNGGIGGHIGRNAELLEIPVIFNSHALPDTKPIASGELVTMSGETGAIYRGIIPQADQPDVSMFTEEQLTMIRRWRVRWKENPWRYLAPSEREFDIAQLTETESKHNAELPYIGQKAREVDAFTQLIPSRIRMDYEILDPHNVEAIKQKVKEILASGSDATIRTSYYPNPNKAKGPWVWFNNDADVDEFFSRPDYSKSKYGGFTTWLERDNSHLTEVIIGRIPKDKLNPAVEKEHASWTLSVNKNREIVVQVRPFSPHLREHEHTPHSGIITYTIPVDPQSGRLQEDIVPDIGGNLKQDALAMQLQHHVITHIRSWWDEHNLAARLAVIGNLFPRSQGYVVPILQGQARVKPDGTGWVLVYGGNVDLPPDEDLK